MVVVNVNSTDELSAAFSPMRYLIRVVVPIDPEAVSCNR